MGYLGNCSHLASVKMLNRGYSGAEYGLYDFLIICLTHNIFNRVVKKMISGNQKQIQNNISIDYRIESIL